MFKLILLCVLSVSLLPQMQQAQVKLKLASLSSAIGIHKPPTFTIPLPLWGNSWGFGGSCNVACHRFACGEEPSHISLCAKLQNNHHCCEKYTGWSSTTSTTTPSTTTWRSSSSSSTTVSSTTTANPLGGLCPLSPPEACSPEPFCSPTTSPFTWWSAFRQGKGCEHRCWEFCFKPCACKTASRGNCEYDTATGSCVARKSCSDTPFQKHECHRANTFYSKGGILCVNRDGGDQTKCENATTVYSVNVAGESTMDQRGIEYHPEDNSVKVYDQYNTRVNQNNIMDLEGQVDRFLYGTYTEGESRGETLEQCLSYPIRVNDDGEYELSLRTLEPSHEKVGKRLFSVTLNGLPIVPHVDLRALSERNIPVNIVTLLKIETIPHLPRRRLIIEGHGAQLITNLLKFKICVSDCRLCPEFKFIDPGYIISGFSLIRFGGQ